MENVEKVATDYSFSIEVSSNTTLGELAKKAFIKGYEAATKWNFVEVELPIRYTQVMVKTIWEKAGGGPQVEIIEMGMLCEKWESTSIDKHKESRDTDCAWPNVYKVTAWRYIV